MRRTPPALAAGLLTLALTAACSAGATPATTASRTSTAPTSTAPSNATPTGAAPTTAAPTTAATADVQRLTLTVRGSSITGDTGTVPVRLGRPVELTVTSDVADEVHVHGVDVGRDVPAGGTVVIDFVQQAPGRFEVELERRKRVLTRLQVS